MRDIRQYLHDMREYLYDMRHTRQYLHDMRESLGLWIGLSGWLFLTWVGEIYAIIDQYWSIMFAML